MEESPLSQLKAFTEIINTADFVDYTIQLGALNKDSYLDIWNWTEERIKSKLLYEIAEKGDNFIGDVLKLINDHVPNIREIADDGEKFRKSTIVGSFPKFPPNYVKRHNLVHVIKQKLMQLAWNETLVVYGMMGYGKSCLINEVLNDGIVRKSFDYNIFWINLGEHHNCDNILQTMWNLYMKLCKCSNKAYRPEDVVVLKEMLQDLILDPRMKNTLLVLDDVCNSEVLDYFDIGCRRVVTTQDKKILKEGAIHSVEVRTGFSLAEAQQLFSLSLNTNKDLPPEAEDIYRILKGHPLLLALIGSYLSENKDGFKNEQEIWKYIKTMFSKGQIKLNKFDDNDDDDDVNLIKKIKTCADKLLVTQTLKDRYKDLSIFLPDVNIPPKVLEILWNTAPIHVRNTMNKLAEKSLIVPFYHDSKQTFIYGIHDIHLKYLKEETKRSIHHIHKRLIEGYDRYTKGDYSRLPNDNYSFLFIGYHLDQAFEFDKFQIYFNLRFIEAKIKAVGKDDVVTDMELYKDYITKEDERLSFELDELKKFVWNCGGNLYNFPKTDIVQYALQEDKNSYIYKEAMKYVQSSPHLYFDFKKAVSVDLDDFQKLKNGDDITYACFVNSSKHILVGFSSGNIKLFYERSEKEVSSFVGHKSPVTKLVVSPDKNYFLSIGEDGVVQFWKFNDNSRNSFDSVSSPKTTQANWMDVFSPDEGKIHPKRVFELPDDRFVCVAFSSNFPSFYYMMTGSKKGVCNVWDLQTKQSVFQTIPRGYEISCVWFSSPELIFSYDDLISIYDFKILDGGEFKTEFYCTLYNHHKVSGFYLNKNELVSVSQQNIRLWNVSSKAHQDHPLDIAGDEQCLCQVMTCDSTYLIVSTKGGRIYCWDVAKRKITREIKSKGLAKSLDTFYDEDNTFHILLIGSDKRTLQQCYIYPFQDQTEETSYNSTPPFTVNWQHNKPFFPLVSCPDNKIQIFRSYSLISETRAVTCKITRLCLTPCSYYVIYGLANGEIHLFNIKTKTTTMLPPVENRGRIEFLSCYSTDDSFSYNSLDNRLRFVDLNTNYSDYPGVIVAVCSNNCLTVHQDGHMSVLSSINNPVVFPKGDILILVEEQCQIRRLDLNTKSIVELDNDRSMRRLHSAAFCGQKNYLLLACYKRGNYFLDLVQLEFDERGGTATLKDSLQLSGVARSCAISVDGALTVAGFNDGDILVWNTQTGLKKRLEGCHCDSVDQLVFAPGIDPVILISFSEEVSWWNLTDFTKRSKPAARTFKPNTLEILNVCENQCNMDIGFWSRKSPVADEYLLSCLRLNAKPVYLSASSDFNTFLVLDEKGKVYIIERIDGG